MDQYLCGLCQPSGLLCKDLERWMLWYGMKQVCPNMDMFRLQTGNKCILVSTYVDKSLCATNSTKLYKMLVQDLSKRYKLSDQGEISQDLSIAIDHD